MNSERIEALLWERIDGTISEHDLAALDAALAQHPELEDLERQVARLASSLDGLEELPSPGELRKRITGSVAESPRSLTPTRKTGRPARRSRVFTPWLPIAASLTLGIALGYLLRSVDTVHVDETIATGTMAVAPAETNTAEKITLSESRGTVLVTRSGEVTSFELSLAAEGEYELLVRSSSGDLNLASFDDPRGVGKALGIEEGELRLHSLGPAHHLLAVTSSDPNSALDLEIVIDGTTVARHTIQTPREGRAGGE